MKIYTKTGDSGTTSLLGGQRVPKSHLRIEAYGTVDELNAYLGLLRDQDINRPIFDFLVEIQEQLFTVGSHLAAEPGASQFPLPAIDESLVGKLEKAMDQMDEELPALKNFVLPGGHPSVSFCHLARCVCRRAERTVIRLNEQQKVDEVIIRLLNRLSDYLFVLGRKMAQDLGVIEMAWKPRPTK